VRSVILLLVLAAGCSSAPPLPAPARCPEPAVATAEAPAAAASASASAVATPSASVPAARPLGVAPLPTEAPAPTPPSDPSLAPEEAPFGPLKDHPDVLVFREQDATGRCGAYVVGPPVGGPLGALQIRQPDGTLVAQLRPSIGIDSYFPSACVDLTGDGSVELVVSYSTGGAHCCHTDVVLELVEPPRVLLAMDMDDGGYAFPMKLRPGKSYQLVSRDMVLAGAGLAAHYAGVPGFPKVLDWNGQRFVDRTRRFPAFVAAERAATLKELRCEPDDPMCLEVLGAFVAATSRLVGDWPQQRARLAPAARTAGDRVNAALDAAGR
jgi:hypothetical protein